MKYRSVRLTPALAKEWHEIDAEWDSLGYASAMLLALGESTQWAELVQETAENTHATVEEVWDGMAAAVRRYLESLDARPEGDLGQGVEPPGTAEGELWRDAFEDSEKKRLTLVDALVRRDERIGQLERELAGARSGLATSEAERERWRAAYGMLMDGIFELLREHPVTYEEEWCGEWDPADGADGRKAP